MTGPVESGRSRRFRTHGTYYLSHIEHKEHKGHIEHKEHIDHKALFGGSATGMIKLDLIRLYFVWLTINVLSTYN